MPIRKITIERFAVRPPEVTQRLHILERTLGFRAYVRSFYGPKGIYDMGATDAQIADATVAYVERLLVSETETWGDGDSVDRERVRDILIKDFGLVFPDKAA